MNSELTAALRQEIRGDVLTDAVSRGIYATDASFYQITPRAIVTPRDAEDVRAAVRLAAAHGVPVLPRAGGTSLAGQTVGDALVIDVSKHMNRVLELDAANRRVRVEPGLVRDELNAVLAPHGLHFAPDPATSSRANVGGMIANNSSGTRSILHGMTIDHVVALRVLLADGTELELRELEADEWLARELGGGREAEIYRGLRQIVRQNHREINARFPRTLRRVGGYPLDRFLVDEAWNPAWIFVGSEGTLGFILEATLNLEPLPPASVLAVPHFRDLLEAIGAVKAILPFGPSAVEVLDRTVLSMGRENLEAQRLVGFAEGDPEAVLLVEFQGKTRAEVEKKATALTAELARRGLGYHHPVFTAPEDLEDVWAVRKNGLGLMLGMKGERKPLAFIEDAAVPIPVLDEYVAQMREFCSELGVELPLYAHASVGVLHLRPALDLKRQDDIERMVKISERSFELVTRYHGSFSSEHGDGLARSAYMERFFGPEIYRAFKDVKRLFDPRNLMNPGKIVEAPPIDRDLRYGTSYEVPARETFFHYRDDGGFAAAVELCSGVGQCRKTLGGTMCPSYIATRDEEHSTRGRANALRLAMSGQLESGQLGEDGMTSERLHEVLDLCLSCKGCKAECPSNVDLARLKSEFLQGYREAHGTSLRDRLMASSPRMARFLAGPLAPLVNAAQKSVFFRKAAGWAGIHPERILPSYARQTFQSWWRGRGPRPGPASQDGREVALFVDTYLDHHEPGVGRAAVALLESCGYAVRVAAVGCCQRPRISHGFLREARRDGEATLRGLDDFLRAGIPVVVCEPSCASALGDDLPDLIADVELGRRAAQGVMMIDVFLARELEEGRIAGGIAVEVEKVLIHGHCHQKALYGTGAMKRVLAEAPGVAVEEVDSGCCGMAGAFGYEREHYELSKKVGEDRLFPALAGLDEETAVVACGFSCRHQIEHFSGRRAMHWVELFVSDPSHGTDQGRPRAKARKISP